MGLAASMGQFLLCAGAPGKRFALPHSQIMMHQPSGGFQGQASDIAIQAERMLYIKRLMAELIAFHTGQNVEQIEGRLRAGPLVHGRAGQGVRHHRQGDRGPGSARRLIAAGADLRSNAAGQSPPTGAPSAVVSSVVPSEPPPSLVVVTVGSSGTVGFSSTLHWLRA
jgi:hypothetical protein